MIPDELRRIIIRTMVKGVEFNPSEKKYTLQQKSLTDQEWQILLEQSKKFNINEEQLRGIVKDIIAQTSFAPKIVTKYNLHPQAIEIGQHFQLKGKSAEFGQAVLELMCVSPNKYLVLSSERNVLTRKDLIESVTMPWNSSFVIDFKTFRCKDNFPEPSNFSRFPANNKLYRTYSIERIELFSPADVYEIIDGEIKKELTTPKTDKKKTIFSIIRKIYTALNDNKLDSTVYTQLEEEMVEAGISTYSVFVLLKRFSENDFDIPNSKLSSAFITCEPEIEIVVNEIAEVITPKPPPYIHKKPEVSKSKFCIKCGNKITISDKFCIKCGRKNENF